ncbi:cardiolipin synthase [Paenibacillus montaniterrae]|uniref:Cardiolipin synthase n=1 Tax=Paenibacillus montaniterrae TaxID=429341 RepID=A0A919YVD1_9BACL|nr:cardiolipin synthase [Paenibacillus montaniterrae]GIP18799.1 cardiolipin synthase [Paenibacillus montaniterrae]
MIIWQQIYMIITILNIILAMAIIFLERRNISSTWAWVMVLFFIPVVGFILYLILGQKFKKRKLAKLLGITPSMISDLVKEQHRQLKSGELDFAGPEVEHYADLISMNLTTGYSLFTSRNEVDIYTDGNKKFDALIKDIEQAQHHIHLVYYIVRDDELGRRLMGALTKKAREGIEVRFLYDHIGSSNLPKKFFKEFRAAGGLDAAFFPSRIPYLNFKINFRNHRKLVVVDGQVGYIGGFNIGDEYLGLNKHFGKWRDTHLRIRGEAVLQMQAQFIIDWSMASSNKIEFSPAYFPSDYPQPSNHIGIQVVASGPDSEYQEIKNSYIKMIYAAKQTVYLQTPYFVPDSSLLNALRTAALSGKDVRLMVPSKPDHFFVFWATQSYLEDLLSCGIKIYLYEAGFLHAKTLVVDGMVASVGTANLDIRSFKLNFEMNAFIYNQEVATRLENIFIEDMKASHLLTLEEYQRRPLFNRFKESISRLLSPIL